MTDQNQNNKMQIVLPNKVYTILKWICLLAIPAGTFIASIAEVWGFNSTPIVQTISALGTLAGAVIAVSNKNYYQNQ